MAKQPNIISDDELTKELAMINDEIREFEWTVTKYSYDKLLRLISEEKLIFPATQRGFVWSKGKQNALIDSVRHNFPPSAILLAECNDDGKMYFLDGRQRNTTVMLNLANKDFTEDQRKLLRSREIPTIIVKDMTMREINEYFPRLNEGQPLAPINKEFPKLNREFRPLFDIADRPLYEEMGKIKKLGRNFTNGSHHLIIAAASLLAVSGIELDDLQAKSVVKQLIDNKEKVIPNLDKAEAMMQRIDRIYSFVVPNAITKSLIANFTGILPYVLVNEPDLKDEDIVRVIHNIFLGDKPIQEYRDTTTQGGASAPQCKARYNLIVDLAKKNKPVNLETKYVNAFSRKYKDQNITTGDGTVVVDFNTFSKEDKEKIATAAANGDLSSYDQLIMTQRDLNERKVAESKKKNSDKKKQSSTGKRTGKKGKSAPEESSAEPTSTETPSPDGETKDTATETRSQDQDNQ